LLSRTPKGIILRGEVFFGRGANMDFHRSGRIHPVRLAISLVRRPVWWVRKARARWQEDQRYHENHWRYRLNPKLLEKERARADAAPDVSSCQRLEMPGDGLNASAASRHLGQLGCLLVRGNAQMRAAVADYRDFLDRVGYTKMAIPRGGALWFKEEDGFRFHIHRLVQQHFHELCSRYLGTTILLSSVATTATIRTVAPAKAGLVPFHQDISPVAIDRALTFWVAIDPDAIGEHAPGLRFIASTKSRWSRMMSRDASTHELTKPGLRRGDFFWTPKINAGDVMIFDGHAPHASYSHNAMTLPRTSVDLRVSQFTPHQAISYLKAGHGPVIFNREEMIAPAGLIAETPPEFSYDLTRITSPALRKAVESMTVA
jgi:hypothetical protein